MVWRLNISQEGHGGGECVTMKLKKMFQWRDEGKAYDEEEDRKKGRKIQVDTSMGSHGYNNTSAGRTKS